MSWHRGSQDSITSSGRDWMALPMAAPFERIARCDRTAPLGSPVEPEEYLDDGRILGSRTRRPAQRGFGLRRRDQPQSLECVRAGALQRRLVQNRAPGPALLDDARQLLQIPRQRPGRVRRRIDHRNDVGNQGSEQGLDEREPVRQQHHQSIARAQAQGLEPRRREQRPEPQLARAQVRLAGRVHQRQEGLGLLSRAALEHLDQRRWNRHHSSLGGSSGSLCSLAVDRRLVKLPGSRPSAPGGPGNVRLGTRNQHTQRMCAHRWRSTETPAKRG